MVRKSTFIALVGVLVAATAPALAESVLTEPMELMTTFTTDLNKGVAEFNPTEILTPKPIEPAAAEPAPKMKKKHYARRHMKKMAKK